MPAIHYVLISAGIACLIAAIVGGGLKAFGIEIPLLTAMKRQVLLGALGVTLLGIGLWDRVPDTNGEKAGPASDNKTAACGTEEGAVDVARQIFEYLHRYVPDDADTAVNSGTKLMKLARIANAIGVKGDWTNSTELYVKIEDFILAGSEGNCSQARLEELFTKIKAEMNEDF